MDVLVEAAVLELVVAANVVVDVVVKVGAVADVTPELVVEPRMGRSVTAPLPPAITHRNTSAVVPLGQFGLAASRRQECAASQHLRATEQMPL